ncbi:MAG TPA: lysophospholipid acyltransferase family protein [Fibrobacteraceae bacterium]|nr:lysophospholipid acyltransferase family protein [Fibrobacteraceae bacterium]
MFSFPVYIFLRIVGFFFAHLPRALDQFLFHLLWPMYRITHTTELSRVSSHLDAASLRPKPQRAQIYEAIFLNALDSLRYLTGISKMESQVHIVNRNLLQNQLNSQNPVVVVSIHTGAFEMMHRALAKQGRAVNLIASHHHHPGVDRFLRKVRSFGNLHIFRPDEAPKLLHSLIRKKGIVAMMADQSRHGKGNRVDFLGRPNQLWLRLAIDACQEGAAVITFRAMRKGGFHVLKFENLYPPRTPPHELLRQITGEFERWILENPEQWTWNYPRLWIMDKD